MMPCVRSSLATAGQYARAPHRTRHAHSLWPVKIFYALSTFPFLLFFFPILGDALHSAQYTAYDMGGLLCPKLSDSNIREKLRLEAHLEVETTELPFLQRVGRLWRLSSTRRWTRVGCGAVFPPIRFCL
jgi:hypothetical protein